MSYSIWRGDGMQTLRSIFPNGAADSMNFCLFSTSGIHGSHVTIEDVEGGPEEEFGSHVTFLVIHPRTVTMHYGNCIPETPEDFAFLKKLRASSTEALKQIGYQQEA